METYLFTKNENSVFIFSLSLATTGCLIYNCRCMRSAVVMEHRSAAAAVNHVRIRNEEHREANCFRCLRDDNWIINTNLVGLLIEIADATAYPTHTHLPPPHPKSFKHLQFVSTNPSPRPMCFSMLICLAADWHGVDAWNAQSDIKIVDRRNLDGYTTTIVLNRKQIERERKRAAERIYKYLRLRGCGAERRWRETVFVGKEGAYDRHKNSLNSNEMHSECGQKQSTQSCLNFESKNQIVTNS